MDGWWDTYTSMDPSQAVGPVCSSMSYHISICTVYMRGEGGEGGKEKKTHGNNPPASSGPRGDPPRPRRRRGGTRAGRRTPRAARARGASASRAR